MSKNSLSIENGKKLFARLEDHRQLPFSFVYNDTSHTGLALCDAQKETFQTEKEINITWTAMADESLKVIFKGKFNREFGQCEYTLWFENVGNRPSAVLRDVYVFDDFFEGEHPIL